MLELQRGNKSAFRELFDRHEGGLYRYLLRKSSNKSTAEELFQDVWEKLYEARNKFKPNASFKTYLYRIAHNHFVDYYRMKRRRLLINGENPGILEDAIVAERNSEPQHQLEMKEQYQVFLQHVASLPAEQREVFLLKEESGLSLKEIASVVGINSETAKSRLRYAVKKLQTCLDPDE